MRSTSVAQTSGHAGMTIGYPHALRDVYHGQRHQNRISNHQPVSLALRMSSGLSGTSLLYFRADSMSCALFTSVESRVLNSSAWPSTLLARRAVVSRDSCRIPIQ